MIPILFAFISYVGWGTSDIFGTIATRKVGPYTTTFYGYFFGFLLSLFYIPFAQIYLSRFTVGIVVFNLFLGFIFLASSVIFFEALRIGKASIVGTIAASFTALVVIFSILFLKEHITFIEIIAIAIIFIGTILTTLDFNEIKARSIKLDRAIILAVVTMFLWGFYFTFIKIPVHQIGWFWANFISLLPFPVLLLYARTKGGISMLQLSNLLPLLANGLLGVIANYSFNFAVANGLTAIVVPISGSYPTLFVLLAFFIFKDSIKKQQGIGIFIALIGIIFLSIVSR